MTMRIGYRHADRLISYPYAHNLSMKQQPIRVDTMRGNRCTSSACDALAAEQCNAPHIVRYPPIQCNTRERYDQLQIPAVPPAWRVPEGPDNLPAAPMGGGGAWPGFEGKLHHTHSDTSAAGVESAGGSGGPGCGARGRRQGLTGLRGEAPPHTATQATPVWRASEGPEGTGGLRDRPLRAAGSRVAISRAAGPEGARNISGATSNKTARPGYRRARLRCPWAAAGPGRASRRRAERSSQRGRLAGGPPPTGTPSSPA